MIELIARPIRLLNHRGHDWRDGHKGPVLFIFRSRFDPALQDVFLSSGEFFVRLRRRHDLILILADDAAPDLGFGDVSRHDGPLRRGTVKGIEAQVSLPILWIEAVTGETIVRENGPNIAIVG